MMKKTIIAVAMAAASLTAINAHAISQGYAKALERAGCSERDVGNGACVATKHGQYKRVRASEPYHAAKSSNGCTQVDEANGRCENEQSPGPLTKAQESKIKMAAGVYEEVNGLYQGEAVDKMEALGWKRMNQEGTKWKKGNNRITLTFTDSKVDSVDPR